MRRANKQRATKQLEARKKSTAREGINKMKRQESSILHHEK
jgi:hypothetical protein